MKTTAYAAHDAHSDLVPYTFEYRDLRDNDVAFEVLYCGVCHSDLHTVRNDWGNAVYPVVPGHEIVGRVIEVGSSVNNHAVGDIVAVGCIVDSCQHCDQCEKDQEQYCREGFTPTYGAPDRIDGKITQGGYAKHLVSREEFVLKMPEGLDIAKAAPLLCAGITTYSPLRTFGVTKGSRVAVIGLGGLGHMAVKIASAMGAHVTMISRTPDKAKDADELGANAFLLSSDEEAMAKAANGFDVIIDTVPVDHDINPYLPLLDIDGTLALVGQIGPIGQPTTVPLIFGRRRVAGSLIGGIAETQEMLDFCAEHNVLPDVEMISIDQINEAYDRLDRSDVRYRFVIDMASLEGPAA
ncbi:NAD(P)-dependent alcohol dehydrogenase [Croceicoccus gelatinilyticus]|uniref:NAD(P)-dependent alcohol dehydrogenase n=1 Tax=Croceicoccus gelatinilyticus TaxID=2835536 RepID=UPI001BD0751A|nr:NAD(P)-dependent alcohol dehydrogenase [Croceicoccus gelatinilyticus]MBS7670277.1 NAD(P)-dependent alcohol dehydrogenase [Croceicoccus gelatinilyticus]